MLFEKLRVGGIIADLSTVSHYFSAFQKETGVEFANKMSMQLKNNNIDVHYEEILAVKLSVKIKEITTNNANYQSKSIIIANGSTARKLEVIGGDKHEGKSFATNPYEAGKANTGKDMFVIGGAGRAAKEAIYLSQFAKTVTIVCIENELISISEFNEKVKNADNIKVKPHTKLTEIKGEANINSLVFEDLLTGKSKELVCPEALVFVNIGLIANSSIYPELELEKGYIKINSNQETNICGVFGAGDKTSQTNCNSSVRRCYSCNQST